MLNKNVQQSILEIVSEALNEQNITVTSSNANCKNWDSLAQLIIMMKIEEKLDIKIEFSEITRLTSVGLIIEIVENHINES